MYNWYSQAPCKRIVPPAFDFRQGLRYVFVSNLSAEMRLCVPGNVKILAQRARLWVAPKRGLQPKTDEFEVTKVI
jgi:hypothetical protein